MDALINILIDQSELNSFPLPREHSYPGQGTDDDTSVSTKEFRIEVQLIPNPAAILGGFP